MLEEYEKYIVGDKAIIPYGIKRIQDDAFSDCKKITSAEIPNSVVAIGRGAFASCLKEENYMCNNLHLN